MQPKCLRFAASNSKSDGARQIDAPQSGASFSSLCRSIDDVAEFGNLSWPIARRAWRWRPRLLVLFASLTMACRGCRIENWALLSAAVIVCAPVPVWSAKELAQRQFARNAAAAAARRATRRKRAHSKRRRRRRRSGTSEKREEIQRNRAGEGRVALRKNRRAATLAERKLRNSHLRPTAAAAARNAERAASRRCHRRLCNSSARSVRCAHAQSTLCAVAAAWLGAKTDRGQSKTKVHSRA